MAASFSRIFAGLAVFVAAIDISLLLHHETTIGNVGAARLISASQENNKPVANHTISAYKTVKEFLNCSQEESSCSFFEPVSFFDDASSPMHRHQIKAHQQLYSNPNRTLNANWARFTSKEENIDWTYVHVRKAGGNTMYEFAQQLARTEFDIQVEIMPSVPVHRLVKRIGQEAFIEKMKSLVNKTVLFTFIRDPVSRFVSAMGQVAQQKPHVLQKADCSFHNDPRREIKCILDLLIKGETVNDHYSLASIEMYQMASFASSQPRVAVFALDGITDLFHLWNMQPFRRNEAIKPRYSVDMLNDNMIRDICTVYEADIYMMRMLGMTHLARACASHLIMVETSKKV
jgi:hypothetical protein